METLAVGENPYRALKTVLKKEGIFALYRGFAPRLSFFWLIGLGMFMKEESRRRSGL